MIQTRRKSDPSNPVRKRSAAASSVLALSLLATLPLGAQSLQSVRVTDFAVSAGVAFPQGDALEPFDPGFIVSGAVNYRPVNSLLGYRLEGMYARVAGDELWPAWDVADGMTALDVAPSYNISASVGVLGGTGNLVLRLPMASAIQPYLIGGAGVYHVTTRIRTTCPACGQPLPASLNASDSDTRLGLNGGAGLEFRAGALRAYVEGRFHGILSSGANTNLIPISVGIRF